MALNLSNREIMPEAAQEIYDEYEIRVSSETPKIRAAEIGRLMAEEGQIPVGKPGWVAFEQWAFRAVQIIFAGHLSNIEMHPNKGAAQRRDVVARNLGDARIWRHIREDYETRQVIFEVKNYADLSEDDFRQALSYSSGPYGRCVFIITRATDENLRKGAELDWVRLLYNEHKRVVIKMSSKVLCNLLGKLRNPQKHNAAEKHLEGLIDQYERRYLAAARSKA